MKAKHNPEIEQLILRFKQVSQEAREIYLKLMVAGAWPLDDDQLDGVAGGQDRYIPSDDEIGDSIDGVIGPGGQMTDAPVVDGPSGGGVYARVQENFESMVWHLNAHVIDPTDMIYLH